MNAGRYQGASLPFAPSSRLAPQSERQSAIEAGNDRKILERPGQTAEAKGSPRAQDEKPRPLSFSTEQLFRM
jgi:hypothetical protein